MKLTVCGKFVFLPIEVMNREYKAKLFLANFFLNAGYSVVIGSIWHMDKFLDNAENTVYITKDFYKYRSDFLKSLHKNNHFVVGWDEEGLIYDTDDYYIGTQLNAETLTALDLIITWGERQGRTIEKFLPSCRSRICSLGNPRLDLLSPNITKKIFEKEIDYIHDNFGRDYILVNSNFNVATRKDYDSIGAVIDCNGSSENTIELVEKFDKLAKKLAPKFFIMVKHIAKQFPKKTIVFRPHPAENVKTLKDIFAKYDNIHVVKKFAINPWLVCASLVIHSGCTTGMEAAIMGKKVISYQPIISVPYPETIPNKVSKIVHTEDELFTIIQSLSEYCDKSLSDEQKSIIQDYVSIDHSKTSSERIVEKIDEENRDGAFYFSTPFFKFYKLKKTNDFNIEFGSLQYSDLKKDLLYAKEKMGFAYKEKVFFVAENVFFIVNTDCATIKRRLDFMKFFHFAKRVAKKIFRKLFK